ncbi:hypothetical protein IY145_11750 [Methylosinus sp. H3A]|uniref:hypothetical protein n=1 Tax=Methylosinus sp. H3A TaxID=2785786 RepID=UPI0018C2BFE7|nr:hypothetical protein [Methylosinus sp. H3A]MBG0810052.1 hypothetical protein [Methylosinus sp. H3A]
MIGPRALAFGLAVFAASMAAAAEEKPSQAYGEDHPTCQEWTDGCLVCARREDGSAACSMVGVACLPAAVVCLKSK